MSAVDPVIPVPLTVTPRPLRPQPPSQPPSPSQPQGPTASEQARIALAAPQGRRVSIRNKVFLLLLIQSLLAVVAFFLLVSWAFDKGFAKYSNEVNDGPGLAFAQALEQEYARAGSWRPLIDNPQRWMALAMVSAGHRVGNPVELQALFDEFKGNEFPISLGVAPLPLRFVLFDSARSVLIGSPRAGDVFRNWPIRNRGAIVGYLGVPQNRPTAYDMQFRHRFLTGLAGMIVGIVLLCMPPALFIARLVTRPVRAIGRAARSLAAGQACRVLSVGSNDELGDLARDFNELSAALERNQSQQREWLAEISHELRTPVANLMAEAEAVIDGLRPPSRQSFQSLYDESHRLSRLIGDLHELSLLDGGMTRMHPSEIRLDELLGACVAALQARLDLHGVRVGTQLDPPAGMRLIGDADKLRRVFMNLLENSLSYTDPGGRIRIAAARQGDVISICYEDSSPGVASHELPHLFERLYRGDASRNRSSGGAGLGLAIVQSIIEAHGGHVTATHSALGGVRFDIRINAVPAT